MFLKHQTGSGLVKWRLHTQFEVDRFVPTRIDVTPDGGGDYDERAVLERNLEADRLYVMDRGYAKPNFLTSRGLFFHFRPANALVLLGSYVLIVARTRKSSAATAAVKA
jgi:hypothetical protein